MAKVFIAAISGSFLHPEMVDSFLNLGSPKDIMARHTFWGTTGANTRNHACQAALQSAASHLLLLDGDATFPSETLELLLRHQKPVIGCVARRRGPPFDLVGIRKGGYAVDIEADGLSEMEIIGSHVKLIQREVLELGYPWFNATPGASPKEFDGGERHFCRRAWAAGFSVWADFTLSREVGHMSDKHLRWQHS